MTPASEEAPRSRRWVLDAMLALLAPAILVAAMYLSPFVRDPSLLPLGADTYGSMWRTDLVRAEGISALTPERTSLRKTLGERPAYPVALSLLRSITGTTSLELMWVLPAAIAAAIAIAAAGLAIAAAGRRRWGAGLVGLGVAASAFVAQTAVGHGTALVFDVLALSAAVLAIRTAIGPVARGWVGAAVLLGSALLFHWLFALLFSACVLGLAALVALGRALLKGPARPPAGAAVRIAGAVALAVALAAVGFAFAPELPGRLPGLQGGERFTRFHLPAFDLEVTLPAAMLGAAILFLRNDAIRRWALGLLVPWAGLAVVGLVGWFWLDLPTVPYRFAEFALGVPVLIVAGALGLAPLDGDARLRVVATGVAAAAAAALALGGVQVWWERGSKYGPELFSQLGTVARYVGRVPGDPWVLLPYRGVSFPPLSPVRAALPVDLYHRVVLFRGPEGPPADLPGSRVLLHVEAIDRKPPSGGTSLGPGVTLLEGPEVSVPPAPPPEAPGAAVLAALVGACIVSLAAVGSGWAVGLTDLPPLGVLSVSPAFGLAALGLLGTVASGLGAPLRGAGAVAITAGTAASGWAIALGGRRSRRRSSDDGSS